jgi:hypothetical protein
MTEYQPYGVRHFLRRLDPEGAGELRRRVVPLLNGGTVPKGGYADLDQFQLDGILVYRTLVLRRSPAESRPPSPYRLVFEGRFYDVWQRPDAYAPIVRHLGLGTGLEPAAVPPCGEVRELATEAGPTGVLAAVPRSNPVVVAFPPISTHGWQTDAGGHLYPDRAGKITVDVRVPSAGRYTVWIGGSFRDRLRLAVDGRPLADERDVLAGAAYTALGRARLTTGTHRVELDYGGPDLRPGSGGVQFGLGPIVLSRGPEDAPVEYVPVAAATTLCGRSLDWIEALGS